MIVGGGVCAFFDDFTCSLFLPPAVPSEQFSFAHD